MVQIVSIDNNIEKPDHSHVARETIWLIDSNFLLALLHFLYYEMRAMPNVELFDNPKIINGF